MKSGTLLILAAGLCIILQAACRHKKEPAKVPEKISATRPAARTAHGGRGGASQGSLQQTLGLSERQIRQNKLYTFVDDWYGTPYAYGGCKKSGVDCSCFASILYQNVYQKQMPRSAAEIFNQCKMLELNDAWVGDLVFFKINSKKITHVGVLVKDHWFVHASTSRGVIVNSLREAYYKKFFFCAGRLVEG